jgi:hypothetical protein
MMASKTGKKTRKTQPDDWEDPIKVGEAIYIRVGWQGDGGVYRLDPLSEDRLREAYPDALVIEDGLLLGYDKKRDYNRYHRPYWEQIAKMLTALNEEQIANLGGIRIYDTTTDKEIWSWKPKAVNPR